MEVFLQLTEDELDVVCNSLDITSTIHNKFKWDNPGVKKEIRWCITGHDLVLKKLLEIQKKIKINK